MAIDGKRGKLLSLKGLERFVMDTIDFILFNPNEFDAEAVKSVVAYRFSLYRGDNK